MGYLVNWGILNTFKNLGFSFTEDLLHVVGIRLKDARVNYFDDWLGVVLKDENKENKINLWKGTTRPGKDHLLKPINPSGTAIMVPGEYKNAYRPGVYKGYSALKQVRPVKVFRDATLDEIWDTKEAKVEEGLFGIHIHKAGIWSRLVGPYSAGCQVFQKSSDYEEFIGFVRRYWLNGQSFFTYTLIEI